MAMHIYISLLYMFICIMHRATSMVSLNESTTLIFAANKILQLIYINCLALKTRPRSDYTSWLEIFFPSYGDRLKPRNIYRYRDKNSKHIFILFLWNLPWNFTNFFLLLKCFTLNRHLTLLKISDGIKWEIFNYRVLMFQRET